MSFKDKGFNNRFKAMGDEAEGIFEAVYPQGWARYGINRPPIQLAKVPAKIRYTPDYLTSKGLVEVQGFGRDQTFKLKVDKYNALNEWHQDFRVDLFVWDTTNKRYGYVRLHDFMEAWEEHGWEDAFDDGRNPYMALKAEHLPVCGDWVAYEPPVEEEAA
jgi:hypothetical protein